MTPESRAFLAYIRNQPKGRVGYDLAKDWLRANEMAGECLTACYIRHRRLGRQPGFQITPAGAAYLAGADPDA